MNACHPYRQILQIVKLLFAVIEKETVEQVIVIFLNLIDCKWQL
jgi:hypothetical protein